jgi:exosome complex RNA-binding protein Csl4
MDKSQKSLCEQAVKASSKEFIKYYNATIKKAIKLRKNRKASAELMGKLTKVKKPNNDNIVIAKVRQLKKKLANIKSISVERKKQVLADINKKYGKKK